MSIRTPPRRSVRLRLTLLYGALFLVSGAALLAVTYVLVDHATGDVLVARGANGSTGVVIGTPPSDAVPGQSGSLQSLNTNGPSSPSFPSLTPKQADAQFRTLRAQAIRQHDQQMHQLLLQSGFALGAMALISIVLGWLVAGRVLRPLRTITTAARDRSVANLHERLALEGPNDELKELGDTFDALFERLDASFRSQRQFVANASHELRTPLARQRALSQVALGDPDATVETLRAAHERVLVSGAQQERLIDALLTLTRVQAGIERRQSFDLATVTRHVLLAQQSEGDRLGIEVQAAVTRAPALGDPRLVERLVANLVDNALRHNVEGGRVQVVTGVRDGHAIVSVSNSGPVVRDTDVERLLQPFQRLDPNRAGHRDGLGLGLSIVQAIVDAHGATLVVRPCAGGGLDVEVTFAMPNGATVPTPVPDASTTRRRRQLDFQPAT
jgi:signal transduction histidine kinase